MKRISLFLAGLVCLALNAYSQPVRLNNNDNLTIGLPLSASKAIFIQKQESENLDVRDSLWVTDGTPGNTKRINAPVAFDEESDFLVWNGKFYFGGITAAKGSELWVTDGTAAGTHIVADINPGVASSTPKALIAYHDRLYFFADNGSQGKELWVSDGTEAGTSMFMDINNGPLSSYYEDLNYTIFNQELYFTANSFMGKELWKTNGLNTIPLKDINPGAASANPVILLSTANTLYFTATNITNGEELWKTDGSTGGTKMVKDIYTGPPSANIRDMVVVNGKILFSAQASLSDQEIYTTDGTEGGTFMVKDLEPGLGSHPDLAGGVIINEKLIFSAYSSATGRELFITDGTAQGTSLFKDVIPGPGGSDPTIWLDYNFWGENGNHDSQRSLYQGKIFFKTNVNFANQLWITDGVAGNTVLVKDFGIMGILFDSYFYTQSGLYFSANHPNAGTEIFKTQGTTNTTNLFADINSGAGSSMPFFQFFMVNGKVFFTADDGDSDDTHRDLYVLGGTETPLPLQVLNFGAALQNAGVALDWNTQNELNTSHFELERSIDGLNFAKIGRVNAKGNSAKASYHYLDAEALNQKSQKLYYRLKMVDADGKSVYSPVVLIQLARPVAELSIAPNPVSSTLRMQFVSDKKQPAALRIINSSGQIVKQIGWQASAGQNQQSFPLDQLAPGAYFAELMLDGQPPQVQRFIKQ